MQVALKICNQTKLRSSVFSSITQNGILRKESTVPGNAYSFETLDVTVPKEFIFHVQLNRPDKMNALNKKMWSEIGNCMDQLNDDPECRVIVLSGKGRLFCAGIDLVDLAEFGSIVMTDGDIAQKSVKLLTTIKQFQDYFTAIEKCRKPVIAAVHGACVGGGVDLITAADIRYCTKDAWFQVKEVDVGLAADVGTLQRLPKVIGSESLVRELTFSGRKIFSSEALQCGFVGRVYEDKEKMLESAMILSKLIAEKSPVAVQGTKVNLVYSRDHSVQEGLDYIRLWNMCMLQSEDVMKAAMSQADQNSPPPKFSKL